MKTAECLQIKRNVLRVFLGAGEMRWQGLGSRWRSVKVCDQCEESLAGELQNPLNFKIKQKMMIKHFLCFKS